MMIFHLVLHEILELILPVFLFLDKLIIFLPSQGLLFGLESIDTVLKHIIRQLFIDQIFMIVLEFCLHLCFYTESLHFFLYDF